jgi:hypothetical protein
MLAYLVVSFQKRTCVFKMLSISAATRDSFSRQMMGRFGGHKLTAKVKQFPRSKKYLYKSVHAYLHVANSQYQEMTAFWDIAPLKRR